jgi:hypothetical protein
LNHGKGTTAQAVFIGKSQRLHNSGHTQMLSPSSVVKTRKAAVSSGMGYCLLDVARDFLLRVLHLCVLSEKMHLSHSYQKETLSLSNY